MYRPTTREDLERFTLAVAEVGKPPGQASQDIMTALTNWIQALTYWTTDNRQNFSPIMRMALFEAVAIFLNSRIVETAAVVATQDDLVKALEAEQRHTAAMQDYEDDQAKKKQEDEERERANESDARRQDEMAHMVFIVFYNWVEQELNAIGNIAKQAWNALGNFFTKVLPEGFKACVQDMENVWIGAKQFVGDTGRALSEQFFFKTPELRLRTTSIHDADNVSAERMPVSRHGVFGRYADLIDPSLLATLKPSAVAALSSPQLTFRGEASAPSFKATMAALLQNNVVAPFFNSAFPFSNPCFVASTRLKTLVCNPI